VQLNEIDQRTCVCVMCVCHWQIDGRIEMLYEQTMACLSGSVLLLLSLMDHQSSVNPTKGDNMYTHGEWHHLLTVKRELRPQTTS